MFTRICLCLFCFVCMCFAQVYLVKRTDALASTGPVVAAQSNEDGVLDCILSVVQKMDRGSDKIDSLIELSEMYLEIGQKSKALTVLSQTLRVIDPEERTTPKANSVASSILNMSKGSHIASIASLRAKAGLYDEALQLISTIDVVSIAKAQGLTGIAVEFARNGKSEKASELLSQALKVLDPAADGRREVYEIAIAYARMGQCDQALHVTERMPKQWAYVKAEALSAIGSECAKLGKKDKASEVLLHATQVAESIQGELKAQALSEIANAYVDAGDKDKAVSILSEALQIVQKLRANNVALEKIARAYAKAGRYEQAFQVAKSINYKPSQVDALIDIAHECRMAGQEQKGKGALAQAYQILKTSKGEDEDFAIESLANIAVEYAKVGDNVKASEVIFDAIQVIRTLDDYDKPGRLIELAKAYVKAKESFTGKGKAALQKICLKSRA